MEIVGDVFFFEGEFELLNELVVSHRCVNIR